VTARSLRPCGARRDCVSTQAPRGQSEKFLEPLRFNAALATVADAVLHVLERTAGVRVLERDPTSVHAVQISPLRLRTEIDVRVDVEAGVVHLRVSAPRLFRGRTTSRAQAGEILAAVEQEIRRRS